MFPHRLNALALPQSGLGERVMDGAGLSISMSCESNEPVSSNMARPNPTAGLPLAPSRRPRDGPRANKLVFNDPLFATGPPDPVGGEFSARSVRRCDVFCGRLGSSGRVSRRIVFGGGVTHLCTTGSSVSVQDGARPPVDFDAGGGICAFCDFGGSPKPYCDM